MKTPNSAEKAALMLAQGKAGTCGFLLSPEGKTTFMGFGIKAPIRKLRLEVNGELFTEATNPFNLVMRRGKEGRPPWAVLADGEWKTLSISNNTSATLCCLALIDLPPATSRTENSRLPLALKAYFGPDFGGIVVLQDDYDFCNLILAECRTLSSDIRLKEKREDV